MAIRPNPARTHSGTVPAPDLAYDRFGRLISEWISPKGWTVTPAIWVTDPDLTDPCSCGGGLLSAVIEIPDFGSRTLCVSCFDRLFENTRRRYGW